MTSKIKTTLKIKTTSHLEHYTQPDLSCACVLLLLFLPGVLSVPTSEQGAVGLPVLARHEHVDDGVDAGGQVDQDVAGYGQQVVGRV